ncbi:MAG: DUF3488 domain-containing protein [Planctomycetota bacterium]|nr:MAG: DUF3488 domain-containing protein [Planctomycetota bacterium]
MLRAIQRAKARLFALVGVSIVGYAVAADGSTVAWLALPIWLASWPLSFGAKEARAAPRWLLNILAMAATGWVALSAMREPTELVTNVAAYLVFIMLLKLFDKTEPRDLGVLYLASVFLAIGAALTSNALAVGVMLALYAPLAIWTAMSLQLHAGAHAAQRSLSRIDPARAQDAALQRVEAALDERADRALRLLTALSLLGCAAFAVAVFVLAPRTIGAGMLGGLSAPAAGAQTGFDDQVELGEAGLLSESAAPVLELEVTNEQGENLGASMSRVLLRGAVLDVYENGAWRRAPRSREAVDVVNLAPGVPGQLGRLPSQASGPRIVQRIIIRNKTSPHLFAMLRPVSIESSHMASVYLSEADYELASRTRGLVEYTVVSQPQAPLSARRGEVKADPLFAQGPVRKLAERFLDEAGVRLDASPPPSGRQIARAIEQRLQREYTYTTTMTAPRAGQDPIEMFLFQTRRGHCEYFASAMAALCRSVGVPARVVTGYAASEYNPQTGRFIVRQSNAHAWVEALVDPERGVWETFDPSPPDQLAVAHEPPSGVLGQLRKWLDEIEYWWITNVVAFRAGEGEGSVGDAAVARLERGFESLDRVGALLRSKAAPRALAKAAGWGVGVFALVAAVGLTLQRLGRNGAERRLAAAGSSRLLRRGFAARRGRGRRGACAPTRAQRRLARSLQRAGWGRPRWLPPLAHVRTLEPELDEELAAALKRHCEALYKARFSVGDGQRAASLREADRLAEEARRLVLRREAARGWRRSRPKTAA